MDGVPPGHGTPYAMSVTLDRGDDAVLELITRERPALTAQGLYGSTRRTMSADIVAKASKDRASASDRLESERMLAERYAKAPTLYRAERKVGETPRVPCTVRMCRRVLSLAKWRSPIDRARPPAAGRRGGLQPASDPDGLRR